MKHFKQTLALNFVCVVGFCVCPFVLWKFPIFVFVFLDLVIQISRVHNKASDPVATQASKIAE